MAKGYLVDNAQRCIRTGAWLPSHGATCRTYFGVFDAQHVGNGPMARIWLAHHVPISFHGAWLAA